METGELGVVGHDLEEGGRDQRVRIGRMCVIPGGRRR